MNRRKGWIVLLVAIATATVGMSAVAQTAEGLRRDTEQALAAHKAQAAREEAAAAERAERRAQAASAAEAQAANNQPAVPEEEEEKKQE
ncbi:MAG: hypothetical protein LBV45_11460 [Xanthomonadaceae bacterium]|jgi:hypothetical protein|nr:hypothetical protein [Xanthomonadaceae bacterium]